MPRYRVSHRELIEVVTHGLVGGVAETRMGNQEGAPSLLPNFLAGCRRERFVPRKVSPRHIFRPEMEDAPHLCPKKLRK